MITVLVVRQTVERIPYEQHPALLRAYREYMEARKMVQQGLLCNCARQRQYLRDIHRALMVHGVKA